MKHLILLVPLLSGCRLLSTPVDAVDLPTVNALLQKTELEEVRYKGKILTFFSPGMFFTSGDTLYVEKDLWNSVLKDPLAAQATIAHENVHAEREEAMGVLEWEFWYCTDVDFRWEEEKAAYAEEWRVLLKGGWVFTLKDFGEFAMLVSGDSYYQMTTYEEAYAFMRDTVAGLK
jgi:hypothetical protein